MSKNKDKNMPKLPTPTMVRIISIVTILLGLLALLAGILEFAEVYTFSTDLIAPLNDTMIFVATMAVLGIALIIIGYGLLKTLNYAFFAVLVVYVLTLGVLFFMFPDFTGTKILLAVVSFILGDFLAEHEYFFRQGGQWENPPTFFKLISLVEVILGLVVAVIGITLYLEIELPFFNFEDWVTGMNPILAYDRMIYSVILILIGIILLIAAYTLYKTIWFALYIYGLAFLLVLGFVLAISPLEAIFLFPTIFIIFFSLLAGDIVAENEVFFD